MRKREAMEGGGGNEGRGEDSLRNSYPRFRTQDVGLGVGA